MDSSDKTNDKSFSILKINSECEILKNSNFNYQSMSFSPSLLSSSPRTSSLSSSPQQVMMTTNESLISSSPEIESSSNSPQTSNSSVNGQNSQYNQFSSNTIETYNDSSMSDDMDINISQACNIADSRNYSRVNRFFPDEVVEILNKWFYENQNYPYPDENMTNFLAKEANISPKQVRKWFANKRVRSNKCQKQTFKSKKGKTNHERNRRQTKSVSEVEVFQLNKETNKRIYSENEIDACVDDAKIFKQEIKYKVKSKKDLYNFNSKSKINISSQIPCSMTLPIFESVMNKPNLTYESQNINLNSKKNTFQSSSFSETQELNAVNGHNISNDFCPEPYTCSSNKFICFEDLAENKLSNKFNLKSENNSNKNNYDVLPDSNSDTINKILKQDPCQLNLTTSISALATAIAATLYNPYLLINIIQNPSVAFQTAIANSLNILNNPDLMLNQKETNAINLSTKIEESNPLNTFDSIDKIYSKKTEIKRKISLSNCFLNESNDLNSSIDKNDIEVKYYSNKSSNSKRIISKQIKNEILNEPLSECLSTASRKEPLTCQNSKEIFSSCSTGSNCKLEISIDDPSKSNQTNSNFPVIFSPSNLKQKLDPVSNSILPFSAISSLLNDTSINISNQKLYIQNNLKKQNLFIEQQKPKCKPKINFADINQLL